MPKSPKALVSEMNKSVFRPLLAVLYLGFAVGNLVLLSKYNIYVGDDGYLASYLYEYHFTGDRTFMFCLNWPIHQFLVATLGAAYRWLYDAHLCLMELLGVDYYRINALSAALFLLTFLLFIWTVAQRRTGWLMAACVVVFGSLEPFLVMSHSIRMESIILLGLAIGTYGLSRNRWDMYVKGLMFLSALLIINTHLGGWPLLVGLASATLYLYGARALFIYLVSCAISLVVYLFLNDLASPEAIRRLLATYHAQDSVSSYTRAHVLGDLAHYFLAAKYKRHLIEFMIIGAFLLTVWRWEILERVSRALILAIIVAFFAYVILFSYINPYYLVYFYFLMLVVIALSGDNLMERRQSQVAGTVLAFPFVVLYLAIFAMFVNSPGWTGITAHRTELLRHLPSVGMFAAPEYFVNLDPARRRFMVPLAQANSASGCLAQKNDPRGFVAMIADTRQDSLVKPYLDRFQVAARVHIGRLATQGLSDDGDLFVYVHRAERQ